MAKKPDLDEATFRIAARTLRMPPKPQGHEGWEGAAQTSPVKET
jgi:hypothetical protein